VHSPGYVAPKRGAARVAKRPPINSLASIDDAIGAGAAGSDPQPFAFATTTRSEPPAAATKAAGMSSRPLRDGPEAELVTRFLERFRPRVGLDKRITIFREPQLPTGAPDIVAVKWDVGVASRWHPARASLTTRDVQLIHFLATSGPSDLASLAWHQFRRAPRALASLAELGLVRESRGQWSAAPLRSIFAVRSIIAFEAKISDWSGAIEQAARNRWFASESYVLAPRRAASPSLLAGSRARGVGVWVEGTAAPVLRPVRDESRQPVSYASWLFNEWAWRCARSQSETYSPPEHDAAVRALEAGRRKPRAARVVSAVPVGTVPGVTGHARVVALAELAHEATSAAVSERAQCLAADLAEDACIAWVRSASAALAWLLDESTASAGEADHGAMPHGTTTEPDQLDPVESAEAVDVAWDQRWPVRRTATSVIVTTPSGTHAFGVGFSDDEAERAAREMHERDVEAAEHVNGEIDAPTIVRGAPVPFHVARLDCVAFLASLEDESVDLIVTDPAYESLEKHRAHGTTTRLTADWFAIFKNERFPELLRECFRVLKPGTHLYVYSDQETMFVTKPMAEAAGFTWWKHLVWSKTKRDGDEPAAGMGYHYRASHEVIGFYEKGKRRLNDLGVCDVLPAPRVRGYPTEKPVSVSRTLIEQSSAPGELVVDCFMGSASVGEAALLAGRRFAGCDVAERSIALARERLTRAGGVEVGPPSARAQRSLFG